MASIITELRRALEGGVADDADTRHLYARDASMYAITPAVVAFPRHAEDVAAAVSIAAAHDVPVLARGAGTSLAGQCVGPGLVLDLSRHLRRIHEVDPGSATALVDPGVVADVLNRAAATYGLMLGPDTSTADRATIGGMVGNNSAGSGSVRYGMTVDHVRDLDVVLADGSRARLGPVEEDERVRRAAADSADGRIHRDLPGLLHRNAGAIASGYPPHWRRAGGYRLDRLAAAPRLDPSRLVVGSEGTLAIVTRAVVGLVPRPARTVYAVGHFESVTAAIDAVADALACDPVQVELIDRTILDLARRRLAYSAVAVEGDPGALLYVAFSGGDEVAAALARLTRLWHAHGHGYATVPAVTAGQQRALLAVRTAGLGLLMASSTGTRRPVAFIEDTAVDPARLGDYAAAVREVLDRRGLRAGFYGHASVGCLHVRPFVDTGDAGEVAVMREVAQEVRALAAEHGGVNSSEHGDGLARSEFNRAVFGDDLYAAMQEVKRVFDPAGVLNPGKIVDAPPMTAHLRVPGPAPEHRTSLRFADGMRAAADRCQNIGLCRKTSAGVMCPSFMATLEEQHSPRGRAAALGRALGSADPATALAADRLHEMLDLCLMCKACTSECPLDVDIPSLKSEALAARHAVRGVPLRSRALGSVRTLNRLGSATAPVSNAVAGSRLVRRLGERVLGIAAARPLPRYARETTARWFARRPPPAPDGGRRVTVLADSFTTFTEPGIGRAAVELLERAGWVVRLEAGGCCGRAALSKGLVDTASRQARGLAARLGDGVVTGVEPSCTGMLRERTLGLDDPGRRLDVRQLESLLVEAIDDGRLALRGDSWLAGRRIMLHGHCHQKADVGTAATMALLARIPGAEVVEVDAGCCGMAGSFGFEAEHYALSLQVGEHRLFPAIRAEPGGTVLAATGTSCRAQIAHGTARTARHPVELVRSVVADR